MTLLEIVGVLTCLWFGATRFAPWMLSFLKSPVDVTKLGQWAVVTGATDGIGKGYAHQLAKRGLNIMLVSRSPDKLQNVAAEIEEKYKVKTKIVDIDFTSGEDVYDRIVKETEGLEIGTLVNNVGMSYEYPEYFLEIEDCGKKCNTLIDCNIRSVIHVTRAILPGMVTRRRGAVINMSSLSATAPSPLLSVYAATKSFVIQFTGDLEYEYRSKGIVIQCVAPGYVVSNMSKLKRPAFWSPSPNTFAKSALGFLGVHSFTTGYWFHNIMMFATGLLGPLATPAVFNVLSGIRKKALRKKQKSE